LLAGGCVQVCCLARVSVVYALAFVRRNWRVLLTSFAVTSRSRHYPRASLGTVPLWPQWSQSLTPACLILALHSILLHTALHRECWSPKLYFYLFFSFFSICFRFSVAVLVPFDPTRPVLVCCKSDSQATDHHVTRKRLKS
jgi:hypothetical protein